MKTYKDQLDSPLWQRRRLSKMNEAGWICEVCGDGNEKLNIHHDKYITGRKAWEYDNAELYCLCETCHQIAHMDNRKILANAKILGVEHIRIYSIIGTLEKFKLELHEGHVMKKEWEELHDDLMLLDSEWTFKLIELRKRITDYDRANTGPNPEHTPT